MALLRECGAAFDVDGIAVDRLASLVEFYAESQQPALARGLSVAGLGETQRADLLVQAIRTGLRQRPKPDFPKVERYSDTLDGVSAAAIEQKIAAHSALNGYYRGDDIDAGSIKHSTWLIETGRSLAPELRKKHGSALVSAYENLAEAVAGHGENDRALDLLRRAPQELADIPKVEERLKPTLARCELVGKPAAPVTAAVWLNRAETESPIDFRGKAFIDELLKKRQPRTGERRQRP